MRITHSRFGKRDHIKYTAICGRCGIRFDAELLVDDLNTPGLKICQRKCCRDSFNLWSHGVRIFDQSYLVPWTRPDTNIAIPPNTSAPDGPTAK